HPDDGESIFFSWSDLTLRGPGIARTGITSPFMRTAWNVGAPWGTTDDPELMRRWCYYIDECGLTVDEQLSAGEAPCDAAPSEDLRRICHERSLEAQRMKAIHTLQFQERHPGHTLVGQIGCADTTMNSWHVAFVNDRGTPKFLYLDDEPIRDR